MEFKSRKRNRLKYYNYSQSGAYFITICTKDKKCILGKVVVGNGALDVPEMDSSPLGKIVDDEIRKAGEIYESVKIDKYIVMPNHVHMILIVENDNKSGTSGAPSPTNEIVPSFVSMLKRFTNKKTGISLWQCSYHDHMIRNEKEYERIWNYIDTNLFKWEQDRYYIKGEVF